MKLCYLSVDVIISSGGRLQTSHFLFRPEPVVMSLFQYIPVDEDSFQLGLFREILVWVQLALAKDFLYHYYHQAQEIQNDPPQTPLGVVDMCIHTHCIPPFSYSMEHL